MLPAGSDLCAAIKCQSKGRGKLGGFVAEKEEVLITTRV